MFTDDWKAALHECSRLAMFDMLPALKFLNSEERRFLLTDAPRNPRSPLTSPIVPDDDRRKVLGNAAFERIVFAVFVVDHREIEDRGLPLDQANDGREFLGCTRLDDDGVRQLIQSSLAQGALTAAGQCCKAVELAWSPILVAQRQVPGKSLIANLAAAAHYMLSRYHVCAALATQRQMKIVIEGYDAKKRIDIGSGNLNLEGAGVTANRPFPPDFAIRDWAYKGADDGEVDRLRCNSKARQPLIFSNVGGGIQ
jgi:hypothetical protein